MAPPKRRRNKNPHDGSSLDDFVREEGILEKVESDCRLKLIRVCLIQRVRTAMKRIAARTKEKKSPGTKAVEKYRPRMNKLTDVERERLLAQAMVTIYGHPKNADRHSMRRLLAAKARLEEELTHIEDSIALAEARKANRGKKGRPLDDVMREYGLEPKKR